MKGQVSSLPSGRLFRRFVIIMLLVSLSMFILIPAQAATIDVPCDVVALVNAVNTANSNGEPDTLNLGIDCIYNLTATLTINTDGSNSLTINGVGTTLNGNNTVQVLLVSGGAVLNLDGVTVANGNTFDVGGGIQNFGVLTITNSAVEGNRASNRGGGIYNGLGSTLTITNSVVLHNSADLLGGGIFNSGTLILTDINITGNMAHDSGGAIYNDGGAVTMTSSESAGNSADFNGGGIYNGLGSTLTIINSSVFGNAANSGGAILNDGTMSLQGSGIGGNTATGDGGAIANSFGSITMERSAIFGNTSGMRGGAVYSSGTLSMINNTVYGNSASNGGGLYISGGTVTLTNDTISSNSGSPGGGIYNLGTLNIGNILVDNNEDADCVFDSSFGGTMNPSGGILIEDGSCGIPGALFGDPMHGVFTGILPLQPGSLAIDAGDNGICPVIDQRGTTRPFDGDGNGIAVCDLGSFEADGAPGPTSSPTPTATIAGPTATPTATLIAPTSEAPPPPPTPMCEDHNFADGGVVRSNVADALGYALNCRVLYQNGAPTQWLGGDLYNAGAIGIQGVLDLGVIQAVDIFSPDGRSYFEGGAVFCLRGQGTLIWLAAKNAPRVAEIIGSYEVDDFPGFTCATLFEPGTLVLVRENPISS